MDFAPGDRVSVREGFGTVASVEDDRYLVVLDGLGGQGLYNEAQVSAPNPTGSVPPHTASEDYPNLGEILVSKPPLERTASIHAAVSEPPHVTAVGDDPTGLDSRLAGWLLDRVITPVVDAATKGWQEQYPFTHDPSFDWCRFRHDSRCFYPKTLDIAASAKAGYDVWVPEDRGYCPRTKWDQQRQCPVAQPGPNSREPNASVETWKSWEDGGQRVSMLRREAARVGAQIVALLHEAMPAITLDFTPEQAAQAVLDWFSAAEPTTTRDITDIAKRVGGHLGGLDFRLKGLDSIRRKIEDKYVKQQGLSVADAVQKIGDVLRYTILLTPLDYSHDVQQAIFAFQEKGYRVTDEENSWQSGDAYSGLHYSLVTPSGRPIEVQFHTDASFDFKQNKTHKLYEEMRLPSTPLKRQQEIWDILAKEWDHIPIPPGATEFPNAKWYPRPAHKIAAVGGVIEETSPLDYHGATAQRLSLYDPSEPPADDVYFKDIPNLVAFLDYSKTPYGVYIRYVTVRHDLRGQGLARALVQYLYDHSEGEVDWGEVMEPEAWHLYTEYRDRYPDRYQRAKKWCSLRAESGFKAKVGPQVVEVVGIDLAHGQVVLADGAEVDGYEVLYPTYHPTLGLVASKTAEHVEVVEMNTPDGHRIETWWRDDQDNANEFAEAWLVQGDEAHQIETYDMKGHWLPIDGPTLPVEQVRTMEERTAAADAARGCMIALVPPPAVLESLAVHGGEPIDRMHITLAYPGKTDTVDRDALHAAAAEWAGKTSPLDSEFAGIGSFVNGEDPVVWATFDTPGLERAREDLVDILAQHGIVLPGDHGFQPHLTLAYGMGLDDLPPIDPERGPFTFSTVAVAYGDEWTWYPLTARPAEPLGGAPTEAILHDEPEAALPVAYGCDEDAEADPQPKTSALDPASRSWLMRDVPAGEGPGGFNGEVAGAAREHLAKQALKVFSADEQAEIIAEGSDVRAANLDRLDLTGTHYEHMNLDDDEDPLSGWLY